MTKNNDKYLIIFGFIIILIYFVYYFNLYNLLLNFTYLFYNKKEGFTQLFKPNRIFKHKNKIFLLDTKEVLQNGINPKVFNNFEEYQKYIISLEQSFRNNLNIYMNKKKVNLDKIKEDNDIKELEIPSKKKNEEIKFPFYKKYDCNRESAICNQDRNSPFFESIYDPKVLRNFQKEQCNKFKLDQEVCNKFKKHYEEDKFIEKCINSNLSPNDSSEELMTKEDKKECKDNIFYHYNKKYVDDMCDFGNKDKGRRRRRKKLISFEKKCLLEDYFRENMLEFEL